MPKGYGYDKAPKKASGFKMKGYSYPGQSPITGKRKQAELQAAGVRKEDAMSALEDFSNLQGESTNLLEGTNTVYGQMPAPIQKRTPIRDNENPFNLVNLKGATNGGGDVDITPTGGEGGSMWKNVGAAAAEAGAKALVTAGINALTNRKKKPRRVVNAAKNFSQIQITKS